MECHGSPLRSFDGRLVDGAVCAQVVEAHSVVTLHLKNRRLGIRIQVDVVTVHNEHGNAHHECPGFLLMPTVCGMSDRS